MLLTTLRLRSLLSRVVGTTSRRVNSSSSSTPPFLPPVPEAALASLPRQLRHVSTSGITLLYNIAWSPIADLQLAISLAVQPSSPTLSPPPSNSPSTSLQKLSAGPKTPSSSPLSLLSTLDRQSSTPLQATSTDLLNYLRLSAENPSSPPQPLEALVQMMSGEICLLMTGTREEVAELAQRQLERASNIEQGVDVATWVLDVLEGAETRERRALARHLVICTFQELLNTTTRRPRPSLEPLLDLLVSRQEQIRPAFYEGPPPLLLLLEQFSKTYINDLERLKSSSATPPPEDGVSGLELLRVEYLDGVRAIHEALKEVANGRTMRSEILLMEAYGLGRSFKEVWQIWDGMNAEGGVGANTAAVKVVSLLSRTQWIELELTTSSFCFPSTTRPVESGEHENFSRNASRRSTSPSGSPAFAPVIRSLEPSQPGINVGPQVALSKLRSTTPSGPASASVARGTSWSRPSPSSRPNTSFFPPLYLPSPHPLSFRL